MIYAEATGTPTHAIEIFRGQQPAAEGEDFGLFFAGDIRASDGILTWLEQQGVVDDDPDTYALVVPAGEGQDNRPIAVLPIGPAGDDQALVVEQDAARRPGRPSVADDGDTTRVSVVLPTGLLRRLDSAAMVVDTTRSRAMRDAIEAQVARMEERIAEIVRHAEQAEAQALAAYVEDFLQIFRVAKGS